MQTQSKPCVRLELRKKENTKVLRDLLEYWDISMSTGLQRCTVLDLSRCPKTPAPRSKPEQDPSVLLTLMELSLSRVCQSFTFLSVLLVFKRFLWEKGWWNSPTFFPQNKPIHFRCFQLNLKLFLFFPSLTSLPPCLPLASLSSLEKLVQWSFDVKIIEEADPCNGGN